MCNVLVCNERVNYCKEKYGQKIKKQKYYDKSRIKKLNKKIQYVYIKLKKLFVFIHSFSLNHGCDRPLLFTCQYNFQRSNGHDKT